MVKLHSLFEITEQLPRSEMFFVSWEDKNVALYHNELAEVEKHYNKNLYIYNVVNKATIKLFECVALPYNYEHKQK